MLVMNRAINKVVLKDLANFSFLVQDRVDARDLLRLLRVVLVTLDAVMLWLLRLNLRRAYHFAGWLLYYSATRKNLATACDFALRFLLQSDLLLHDLVGWRSDLLLVCE